jgi:hypothetical protein
MMLFSTEQDDAGFGAGLSDDPLSQDAEAGARTSSKAPKKGKKKKKKSGKRGEKSEWDSPLILMGGGGVALLLLAGGVIYYLLTRENADELLKTANANFDSGQYSQSISEFERFVKDHSGHQDISQARVRLGMAKIWRDTERSTDHAKALATAKEVINQIEDEPAFTSDGSDEEGLSQAKRELSSLLTTIAKGLAEQADAATDEALVKERIAQINEVLGLTSNTKYVPQRFQLGNELAAVRETLARVEARQQRGADLSTAIAKIDEAIAAGDSATAFAVRTELVKKYPVLVEDAQLNEKVLAIAAAERNSVKFVEAPQQPITTPAEGPVVAELALAQRSGAAAEGASAPIAIRIDGGLYGLNSRDGALLWRRFVGVDSGSYPLTLPNGAVVAADSQRSELVAVESQSGKLLWRLALEGKLATPVLLGERLLAASDAGRLYVVEAASGNLIGYVEFSQPIRQPPVANERGDRIYVLGEHSNLYTLAAQNLECIGVYYLGHAAGAAATPPTAILNKVIVADNSGAETCQVRVLTLNDQGAPAAEATSYRLSGTVTTPIQTSGRRFAAVTSRGQAIVFEIAAGNDKSALTALASREAQGRDQTGTFTLMHDGHLWLAADELTKLEVLPTGNRLPVRSIERDYRGDAFDYPLQSVGDVLIHVRRPRGGSGAVVAAMDVGANKSLWETALAVPPAGPPVVDASTQRIVAAATNGTIFVLDREAMARRVQDQGLRIERSSLKPDLFGNAADLGGGRLALAQEGVNAIIHYRPNDPRQQLREIELPAPVSGELLAWGEAFAAPTTAGQIYLYGSDDAALLGAPFQPELTPGQKFRWLSPTIVGEGEAAQLAVSDGASKLYLLERVAEPEPHVEASATVDVGPSPLVGRLAAVGPTIFAATESGKLARFAAPDLAPGEATDLGGRVIWGPFATADAVLLATEAKELLAIGTDGAIRWRQPLAQGQPVGRPLASGDQAIVLHPLGFASYALADGTPGNFVEVGQALAAGPVPFAGRLVVCASDGTLLVVNQP